MTKPEIQKVFGILRENRRWVLKKSKGRTTMGWCAASAVRVHHFLTKHGFKPTIVYLMDHWQVHCYNELEGTVLDCTPDQFKRTRGCKIVMRPKSKLPAVWYYGIRKKRGSTGPLIITGLEELLGRVDGWGEHSPQKALQGTLFPVLATCNA